MKNKEARPDIAKKILDNLNQKIVIIFGEDKPFGRWQKERQNYLYKGVVTNQNMREILPQELIIEFDYLNKKPSNLTEADRFIKNIKSILIQWNAQFKITSHKGKCPHIRLMIQGLEKYSHEIRREYKSQLVRDLLGAINFKSNNLCLDFSLINTESKLISLEGMPHYKTKYKGHIEQVVFENDAKPIKVNTKIIRDIQSDLESRKTEFKFSEITPINFDTIDKKRLIKLWRKHFKSGKKNALAISTGTFCKLGSISLQDCLDLIAELLNHVNSIDYFQEAKDSIKCTYEREKVSARLILHKDISDPGVIDEIMTELKHSFGIIPHKDNSETIEEKKYCQSWGFFDKKKNLHAEQINTELFLVNNNNNIKLAKVQTEKDLESKKSYSFIEVNEERYYFKEKIMEVLYQTPSLKKIKDFINGAIKPREFKEIIVHVEKTLSLMYDFKFKTDLTVLKLFIGQTYLVPILNSLFFVGVDATKGGGKTTLLELVILLSRHGFLGGDISPSAIPRTINQLQITIGVDELDQAIGDRTQEDISSIIRKCQRRNNSYVRCVGKDHTPTKFDLFSPVMFTYRGEIEDALQTRSLSVHTARSNDNTLPVLNLDKEDILKPLKDELFFWSIQNLVNINKSNETIKPKFDTNDIEDKLKSRQEYYDRLTYHFDKKALELLQKITGRNTELAFICLQVASLLDIDIKNDLTQVMTNKEESEEISENYYLQKLEEFLLDKYHSLKLESQYIKKDGKHAGCVIYQKNRMFEEFVELFKDKQIPSIGTKKYSAMLKDLGFVEGDTLINVRIGRTPTMCLHFSDQILKRLGCTINEGEIIYHKCSICGASESNSFNDNGQPVCSQCIRCEVIT